MGKLLGFTFYFDLLLSFFLVFSYSFFHIILYVLLEGVSTLNFYISCFTNFGTKRGYKGRLTNKLGSENMFGFGVLVVFMCLVYWKQNYQMVKTMNLIQQLESIKEQYNSSPDWTWKRHKGHRRRLWQSCWQFATTSGRLGLKENIQFCFL